MAAARICPARASSLMRSKMTMFASAATPIVRIMPGEARQRQRDVEEEDRRVEEGRVDAEPEDGDEAEEAVDEEQEERDDEQAGERGASAPRSASPCRASPRPGLVIDLHELDRQRAGLEDERQVLRLADVADAGDLGAVVARDAVRVLVGSIGGNDLISRSRTIAKSGRALASALRGGLSAAAARASRVTSWNLSAPSSVNSIRTIGSPFGAEVLARAGELQVLARHLRDRAPRRSGW